MWVVAKYLPVFLISSDFLSSDLVESLQSFCFGLIIRYFIKYISHVVTRINICLKYPIPSDFLVQRNSCLTL